MLEMAVRTVPERENFLHLLHSELLCNIIALVAALHRHHRRSVTVAFAVGGVAIVLVLQRAYAVALATTAVLPRVGRLGVSPAPAGGGIGVASVGWVGFVGALAFELVSHVGLEVVLQ